MNSSLMQVTMASSERPKSVAPSGREHPKHRNKQFVILFKNTRRSGKLNGAPKLNHYLFKNVYIYLRFVSILFLHIIDQDIIEL